MARIYNSRSDRSGAFGLGWSSWASARLRATPEGADYEGPDGQRALFPRMGSGYGRVLGVQALVEPDGDGLVLRWFSGERWHFDGAGLPLLCSAGPGTDVRLRHDDGRLVELAHVGGRNVRIEWQDERIAELRSSDGRRASYRYDAAGNLERADGAAGVRRYELGEDGRVTGVVDADDVAEVVNEYDDDGRVLAQLSPFGRRTLIAYLPGHVTVTADQQDGPSNVYIHDDAGRVQAIVDGDGRRLSVGYDEWGNPVTVTDRKGAVTVQSYDDRANVVRRVLPTGAEFMYAYDDEGRLLELAAPNGAVVRHAYDGDERSPVRVTDAEGGVTRLDVSDGLVRRVVDPDGVELSFEFDAGGEIVAAIDADGNVARLERDAAGLVVAAVTPLGRRTTFSHDAQGRPVERVDPSGAVWRYEYSPGGRLTSVVDPTGAREEIRYGEHGRPEATVDARGNATGHRYDIFGNKTTVVAPGGAAWRFGYDALCRLTSVADPSGATWLREHDANGNLTGRIDPVGTHYRATMDAFDRVAALDDGLTSATFDYDVLGRALAHRRPDGAQALAGYDRCGRRITIEDPTGGTMRIEYTAGGRVRRIVEPSGRTDDYEYDARGRMAAHTDGAGRRTEYRYDADGGLVERVSAGGEIERFEYDRGGQVRKWTAPGRGVTRYEYDAAGRVTAISDRTSGTRRFGYDAAGNLLVATDANGAATRYAYDERGRLTEIRDPLGGVSTRDYDETGRLVREADPLGRATTHVYDAAGRLVEHTDASGRRRRWSYGASGRVSAFGAAGAAPITIERDALGRAIAIDEPGSFAHRLTWDRGGRLVERRRDDDALCWRYDEDGNRAALVYPDGSQTTYGYDGGGLPVRLHHSALGAIELERDASGRLVGASGEGMRASWRYDDGELAEYELVAGARRRSARLTRDPIGRVVAAVVDGTEHAYSYDAAGQLVAADTARGSFAFAYDAAGRMQRESSPASTIDYEHDAAGQLLARRDGDGAEVRYEYDGAGRRTREAASDGRARTYRWDELGRLVGIETGDVTIELRVDALDELAEVDGRALLWDSVDPLEPLAWTGDRAIVGLGTPLASAAGDDAAGWLAPDSQGTIGEPRDAFGAPAGAAAATGGAVLGYHGEVEVDGLTWLRNRMYDPATRSFLLPDPLPPVPGTACAANPYHYAANNPVGLSDPLGLRPVTDAELRDIRESMGRNVWERGADFVADNWEYIAAGAMVVGGIAIMATGVGGPIGAAMIGGALMSAGGSAGVQKFTTGEVNWGEVAVAGVIGAAAGGAGYLAGSARVLANVSPMLRGAAAGATESVVGGAANRGVHGANPFDPLAMGTDLLVGGGAGGVGGRLGARPSALDGMDDLAARRAAMGLGPPGPGSPTLTRLDVDGQASLYGVSAHGRDVTLRVNPISRTHAETDVMQQLADAGGAGGRPASLYVDHPTGLCGACGRSGAVRSMAGQVGISDLTVVTPQGTSNIVPPGG
jgi:RHS repeat-associated protein